jgi:hypothetical protein
MAFSGLPMQAGTAFKGLKASIVFSKTRQKTAGAGPCMVLGWEGVCTPVPPQGGSLRPAA